ncbi:pilus assembly protein PilM [Chrysiogenes arsenatis]|uniref:pilus assembly protein PilM n=1 Tax=Chrysiogenes arsenatis TaxID=309797 RepID=UPI000426EBA3|nr:pilus assembly protein PilM [Chrysiogenes arsenatis]
MNKKTIGIDFGGYSLKCAACERIKDKITISHLGESVLRHGAYCRGDILNHEFFMEGLKSLLSKVTVSDSNVVIAAPRSTVNIASIEYPHTPLKEALQLARWDYVQYLEEAYQTGTSVDFIGRDGNRDGMSVVDVVATKNFMLANFLNIFEELTIPVHAIDVSTFAVEKLYERTSLTSGLLLLLNVGHHACEFSFILDRQPDWSASVPLGVFSIIEKFQELFQVEHNDALKMISGELGSDEENDFYKMLNDEFIELANRIAAELLQHRNLRYNDTPLTKCILTGGGAANLAFANHLVDILETQVEYISALQGVTFSEACSSIQKQGISKYAVALGLSLRDVNV